MTLYAAVVFIHAATILLFFIAHGVSIAVAFRLRMERDPARVRMLLDLSGWAMGVPATVAVSVGIITGIAAGIMGGWFGQAWIWISLALLAVVAFAMTPMAAKRLKALRQQQGRSPSCRSRAQLPPQNPISRSSHASSTTGTRSRPQCLG